MFPQIYSNYNADRAGLNFRRLIRRDPVKPHKNMEAMSTDDVDHQLTAQRHYLSTTPIEDGFSTVIMSCNT